MEKSQRQKLLEGAIALTCGDRDKQYGDPKINLRCAGEMKRVFWFYALQNTKRTFSPAEQEALDLCFTKLSRIACGEAKADNYADLAAYVGISFECMVAQFAKPQSKNKPSEEQDMEEVASELEANIKQELTHVQASDKISGTSGSQDSNSGGGAG